MSKFLILKNILIIIIFISCKYISTLELRLTRLPQLIIFKDGVINPLFNYTKENKNDCSFNKIYYELKDNTDNENDMTSITVIKNATDIFSPLKLQSSNNITNAYINYENIDDTNSTIKIYHKCKDDNSNNENWSLLNLEFLYNNQNYNIEFIKICKEDSKFIILLTMMILLITAVLYTFISTKEEIKLNIIKEAREQSEIKWWHGMAFVLLASFCLIIIFYFIQYIKIIYTIILTFQSSICLYITIAHFLKKKYNSNLDFLCKVLKKKIYIWQIYKIISITITITIVYFWFISRHWLLNNILAFSLVFVVLSIFTIKNFKICAILLTCVFIYDSFWVFFSDKIFSQNVMVTVATGLNLPIKIEMPLLFSQNPIKNCMLLGLGDLVLPGIIIIYCKHFDKIKQNLNTKYYKVSMILYIISLFLAFNVVLFFKHAQPVLFYICPIFILGLSFCSFYWKDWADFWRGNNITGTQLAVDEIIQGEFTRLDGNNSSNDKIEKNDFLVENIN